MTFWKTVGAVLVAYAIATITMISMHIAFITYVNSIAYPLIKS